ncbi:uncharacterized protein F5891DRAFT_1223172 [Suillus fuscotomentosus]|uniref:Alpha-type protein kinase domain-containing protein n=1 Tax=Suillus fuscotomentosus TaxID=1912939 RepID=A0AAD4HKX3_9AGAM|nr:uncharacterized protein F5891DRAFT_1223172 [Suillus fuscotomentosus]KAG1901455.1 hypothetical protein F5891DRAFT_1223172 [Suillus fuscotomentosus]
MYAANFTTEADQHYCEYAKCFSGPAGTVIAVTYIEHMDPQKQGKWLCEGCSRYQRLKTTTRWITDSLPVQHQLHSAYDGAVVHKRIAEAQRGKSNLPVRALGLVVQQHIASPQAGNSSTLPPGSIPGPRLADLLQTLSLQPGYQEAHKVYEEMWTSLAKLACSMSVPEVDIVESISHVPYRIGAKDLKVSVYLTLLPLFLKWSHGLAFSFEEARLRLANNFEEILPRPAGEDTNAISFHFIKTKCGKQQFHAGKGIEVHLLIPLEKFQEAEKRRERVEEGTESKVDKTTVGGLHRLVSSQSAIGSSSSNGTLIQNCTKQFQQTKHKLSSPSPPATPPQKLRTSNTATISPDAGELRRALQAQGNTISGKSLPDPFLLIVENVAVTLRPFTAVLRIVPRLSLSSLILDPNTSDIISTIAPTQATLFFNPQGKPKYGAFKAAQFSFLDKAILGPLSSNSTRICLKQCYYRNDKSKSIWASALMDHVQQFVIAELSTRSAPPFHIPDIRFVHVALASIEDAGITKTYLVEEYIDESMEGSFTKYISNDSPSPILNLDNKSSNIASLFADGNLTDAFALFEEKHACNEFCKFFQLERLVTTCANLQMAYNKPLPPPASPPHLGPDYLFAKADSDSDGSGYDDFGAQSMDLGTHEDLNDVNESYSRQEAYRYHSDLQIPYTGLAHLMMLHIELKSDRHKLLRANRWPG